MININMSERQKRICEKYSARQADGNVRCSECPMVADGLNFLCRANSTYNQKTREWEPVLEAAHD
jgi:hypothetical protein